MVAICRIVLPARDVVWHSADPEPAEPESTESSGSSASIAVSGGTTPAKFFAALSAIPIAWDKVTVTLVDERFVPPSSPRSPRAG